MSAGDQGLSRQTNPRANVVEEHSLDELAKGLASGNITRRGMLKLTGAALLGSVLSAAFPGVAFAKKAKEDPDLDPGYDPDLDEPIEELLPTPIEPLPPRALVNLAYLPPVGTQGTPQSQGYPGSCAAWASTYGLATFTAAKKGNYSPHEPRLQASPAYIYVKVLNEDQTPQNECGPTGFTPYFDMLAPSSEGGQGGTPSMKQARYKPDCATLWDKYLDTTLPPDPAFRIEEVKTVPTTPDGNGYDPSWVKQIVASGRALAYCTKLYTDFGPYAGSPVPYVGNGDLIISKKTGKPAGHCMLLIGYDDTMQYSVSPPRSGAVLLQNSMGPAWGGSIDPKGGHRGYMWMAYETFVKLAHGHATYVVEPS